MAKTLVFANFIKKNLISLPENIHLQWREKISSAHGIQLHIQLFKYLSKYSEIILKYKSFSQFPRVYVGRKENLKSLATVSLKCKHFL